MDQLKTDRSTFRIRSYECDQYGRVTAANYLRYMQEAAHNASEAIGYGHQYYQDKGWGWIIRDSRIEIFAPLEYGDEIEIITGADQFRRVQSRRVYEIRKADGQLVAKGHSHWVLLDLKEGGLISIPQELIDAYLPNGSKELEKRPLRLPSFSQPAQQFFSYERAVELRDLDSWQHVNNAVYIHYLEECSHQAFLQLGWSIDRMEEQGGIMTPLEIWIEYKQAAKLGESLQIISWISDLAAESVWRYFIIYQKGTEKIVARAKVLQGWVGLTDWQPVDMPAELLIDLSAV